MRRDIGADGSQQARALQVEAESRDEADKLQRALLHCLSLKQPPSPLGKEQVVPFDDAGKFNTLFLLSSHHTFLSLEN